MAEHKEEWGSRLGVILAVAGSAVGLGNFLRFPGQAAANGGGAFLIPYFCALFLLGIPIGWAEWTMGRYGGKKGLHGAPMVMGAVGKGSLARYLGVLGVLIPLGVSTYYVFIETWTFAYFLKYLTGGIGIVQGTPITEQTAAAGQFYTSITGAGGDGSLFTGDSLYTVLSWVVVFAINIYFVFRGLSKGIEKFVSFAMPVMAVCALIVLARVLTLGTPNPDIPEQNVINGLGYMWNPDFAALGSFKTWLAAAGQIFFSLSVGFGVIINYASYMKKEDDVALSGLTASATNELFEVGFGGMITLTAAFVFLGVSNRRCGGDGIVRSRLQHAPGRLRTDGSVREHHRRGLVLHALARGDHELALDVCAGGRASQGGDGVDAYQVHRHHRWHRDDRRDPHPLVHRGGRLLVHRRLLGRDLSDLPPRDGPDHLLRVGLRDRPWLA